MIEKGDDRSQGTDGSADTRSPREGDPSSPIDPASLDTATVELSSVAANPSGTPTAVSSAGSPSNAGRGDEASARESSQRPSSPKDAGDGRLGRYRVLEEIGRGGVGLVYRVRDQELGRDLAMKVLLEARRRDEDATRRFIEEAQIGGQLQHPGITPVHGIGLIEPDRPYFTMKLVKGETLALLLARRESPEIEQERFLRNFEEIAQTMAYAHARGVIHRDLKPSNVMIGAFGEVQVMDWGLAKVLQEGGVHDERKAQRAQSSVTQVLTTRSELEGGVSQAGSVLGTPAYMAPEQARGEIASVDERTDVFGLGAILTEILTGRPPYEGKTVQDVHRNAVGGHLEEAMRRLDRSDADSEIVELAKRCLSPDPRRRPADAGAVARVVRSYFDRIDEKLRAAELEAAEAAERAIGERRRRRLSGAIAGTVTIALIVTGGFYIEWERESAVVSADAARRVDQLLARATELRGSANRDASPRALEVWSSAVSVANEALAEARRSELGSDVLARARSLVADLDRARSEVGEAVRRTTIDAEAVSALEKIRIGRRQAVADVSVYPAAFTNYAAACGEIFDLTRPDATAAGLSRSAIRAELARALDDWALSSPADSTPRETVPPSGDRAACIAVAKLIDPDPDRVRIRDAAARRSLSDLGEIAAEITRRSESHERATPATYELLAASFAAFRDDDGAGEALREGLVFHPDSFWLHRDLGVLLLRSLPADSSASALASTDQAIAHLRAAYVLRKGVPETQELLGRAYERAEALYEAASCFRGSLDRRPMNPGLWVELARILERLGDLDGEIDALRRALELEPGNLHALERVGIASRRRGDSDAAIAVYRELADRSPASPHLAVALGECLLERDRAAEAISVLSRAVARAPNDPIARARLGGAWLRSRSLDDAIRELESAIELSPRSAPFHRLLAVARGRKGDVSGALASLAAASRLDPVLLVAESPGLTMRQGDREEDIDLLRSARAILEAARSSWPGDADVLALLAEARLRLGILEEAHPALDEGDRMAPANPRFAALRGIAKFQQGDFEGAVVEFDRALALGGSEAAIRNNRAIALHESGKAKDAVTELRELSQSHASDISSSGSALLAVSHFNAGVYLAEAERFAEAASSLREAITNGAAESADAHALLGYVLTRDPGERRAAISHLRRALGIDHRHGPAARVLGRVLAEDGYLEQSKAWIRRALEIDPLDARAHRDLGRLFADEPSSDAALSELRRALEIDPGVPEGQLELGIVLRRRGEIAVAVEAFRAAIERDPANSAAYTHLIALISGQGADAVGDTRALLDTLERVIVHGRAGSALALESYAIAALRGTDEHCSRARELLSRRVESSEGSDTRSSLLLAQVERESGRRSIERRGEWHRRAIEILEDLAARPGTPPDVFTRLEEYRRDLQQPFEFLTYASVDRDFEALVAISPMPSRIRSGRTEPSPGLEWTGVDFDDGDWTTAEDGAGFGSSGSRNRVLLEDMVGAYSTVYLRCPIDIDELGRFERFILEATFDDGFIAYLNGEEIARVRAGAPGIRLASSALADRSVLGPPESIQYDVPAGRLVRGRNVLAVQALNAALEDVDFAVAATIRGVFSVAGIRHHFEPCLARTGSSPEATLMRDYLQGRILERSGDFASAVETFRSVLARDRSRPEPFRRLQAVLARLPDRAEAVRIAAEERDRGPVPRVLYYDSVEPMPLGIRWIGSGGREGVVLEVAPLIAFHPGRIIESIRWQVRAANASYEFEPTLDLRVRGGQPEFAIGPGRLLPGTEYYWRLSYRFSGAETEFSPEASFRTGDYVFETTGFDIATVATHDIVGNPGDPEDDALSGSGTRSVILVQGFDGERSDNARTRGLPKSRELGVHHLGDFTGKNALQLGPRNRDPVRIEAVRGRYDAIRVLVTGGRGHSFVPMSLEYSSGKRLEFWVHCPDIDPSVARRGTRVFAEVDAPHPVWRGGNLLRAGMASVWTGATIFEIVLPTPRDEELVALTLDPARGDFDADSTRFNLLAVTGVRTADRGSR
jgi:tetratricopeptide (TPR) repeat protein